MSIRRVRREEWPRLRDIRLRALAEAPYAFGTTYQDAIDQQEQYWRGMVELPAWVAEESDRWVGLVRAVIEEGAAHLISMWVEPGARGKGIGVALIDVVVQWARDEGLGAVTLWVAEGNTAAEILYRRAGFVDTGERQPLPSNPTVQERAMRLDLDRGS